MTVEAYAKVNLTLEVLGERSDGYHALRSLVLPISLADTLEIDGSSGLSSDAGYADDLCLKAADALRTATGCSLGARIRVTKRIPIGGGLGGGSADAAATLRALNGLWGLGLSLEALVSIGASVGSDVPALVLAQHYHRPVLMEGRGEIVRLATEADGDFGTGWLVLVNPRCVSSTPEVFRAFRRSTFPNPKNDLQAPAIARHPEIGVALETLRTAGAHDVRMTGSGSTVFGLAGDETEAFCIAAAMRAAGWLAWNVHALV